MQIYYENQAVVVDEPLKFHKNDIGTGFEFMFTRHLWAYKTTGGKAYQIALIIFFVLLPLTCIALPLDLVLLALVYAILKPFLYGIKLLWLKVMNVAEKVAKIFLGILAVVGAFFLVFTLIKSGLWSVIYTKLSAWLSAWL